MQRIRSQPNESSPPETANMAAPSCQPEHELQTPRGKTDAVLRQAGLSPRRSPPVLRKKLLLHHTIEHEVRDATSIPGNGKNRRKDIARQLISGRITKKYQWLILYCEDELLLLINALI